MRITRTIAVTFLAVMSIGAVQAGAAFGSNPGAAEYKFCVKLMPKKLRYKGQPAHVPTGCHTRLLVFSATSTWEVTGMSGWSGSYSVFLPSETVVFSGNNDPLCALAGGKNRGGGYGGLIDLNESTQQGTIVCAEQAETWYTKEIG